jgi:hypothetical protein
VSDRVAPAVFTPDQVEALNAWQERSDVHPFTCTNRGDGAHRVLNGDLGTLVATVRGWICPYCDYEQSWAHGFMMPPSR